MVNDLTTPNGFLEANDSEYVRLVSLISDVWEKAKGKAAIAVNTELLDANWQTGRYIVEYEQNGNVKAEYGKNMRLFYVRFPKIQTVSGQLTWSHYLELLKCDDPLEMQFYMKECINEGWKVRVCPSGHRQPAFCRSLPTLFAQSRKIAGSTE